MATRKQGEQTQRRSRTSATRAASGAGAALERLSRAYEADADRRLDLLQEIHFALWRQLSASFDGGCSSGPGSIAWRTMRGNARSHQKRSPGATPDTLDEIAERADPAQADIPKPTLANAARSTG